eukprot:TRINITY_DN4675_c0_g4_i1.p1 TRINITY_DN4675_c0_g4~~TRINITY_DN4675_c0_g4_i1.p1  ORF type:complete len:316 (+),score=91.47 TRINITY_DN4675_c0_g4_i1:96-1043(+)
MMGCSCLMIRLDQEQLGRQSKIRFPSMSIIDDEDQDAQLARALQEQEDFEVAFMMEGNSNAHTNTNTNANTNTDADAELAAQLQFDDQISTGTNTQSQPRESFIRSSFPNIMSSASSFPDIARMPHRIMKKGVSSILDVLELGDEDSDEFTNPDSFRKQRKRLRDRLASHGLEQVGISGDGNCQFAAIAHQMTGDDKQHLEIRSQVVSHIANNRSKYINFVPNDVGFDRYVEIMSAEGTWGDNLTLQAAADAFGIPIMIITSANDSEFVKIEPDLLQTESDSDMIWLSYHSQRHYNSVRPAGRRRKSSDSGCVIQ